MICSTRSEVPGRGIGSGVIGKRYRQQTWTSVNCRAHHGYGCGSITHSQWNNIRQHHIVGGRITGVGDIHCVLHSITGYKGSIRTAHRRGRNLDDTQNGLISCYCCAACWPRRGCVCLNVIKRCVIRQRLSSQMRQRCSIDYSRKIMNDKITRS